jgi:hypothetical protein
MVVAVTVALTAWTARRPDGSRPLGVPPLPGWSGGEVVDASTPPASPATGAQGSEQSPSPSDPSSSAPTPVPSQFIQGDGGTGVRRPAPVRPLPGASPAEPFLGGGSAGRPIVGVDGFCVEVVNGGDINATPVQLAQCTGATHQRWTTAGDGSVRTLGKCLEVAGGATINRTPVQLNECSGSGGQRWEIHADGTWLNPQSARCLDTESKSVQPGTRLVIAKCTGTETQIWRLG